jgi:DNA helicase-4
MFGYNLDINIAIEKAIDEIVFLYGTKAEIMLLGRTNYDINKLKIHEEFKITGYQNSITVRYKKYPDLRIFYYTVHRSKGLEADNVIIMNLENKLLGFPNKISDDPILSLALTDLDNFDYAEERRLFYVALTRTKNYTYLMVPDYNPSVFADELIKSHNIQFSIATGEQTIHDNPNCSVCQKGYLVLRENSSDGSKFLGCSNYPQCVKTLKNVELLNGYIKCDRCGGYMVLRNGKYGDFYGCTNYPMCAHTLRIDREATLSISSRKSGLKHA